MLPCTSLWLFLILSIVKGTFQGGIKPQVNAGVNPLYQSDYVRGAAASQGGGFGPLGAKAGGKYPPSSPQGFQQGPFGLQNGYGGGLGYKPVKPGPGRFPQSATRKAGYGNGAGGYPGNLAQQGFPGKAQKAGYGAGSYPYAGAQLGYGAGNYLNLAAQGGYGNGAGNYPQGYGSKLSKPGYPAKSPKAGYRNGAGSYLGNVPQQGFGIGAGFPNPFQQQGISGKPSKAGYGNGASRLSGGAGKSPKNGYGNLAAGYPGLLPQSGLGSKASKAGLGNFLGNRKSQGQFEGALGQLPYRSQSADNLGYDPKSVKAAGGSQIPYGSQAAYVDPAAAKYASTTQYGGQGVTEDVISPSAAVEGPEGVTVGVTAPPATAASNRTPKKKPHQGGYQALGNGQSTWPYAPEDPAYGLTDYFGNGYRGCAGNC